MKNHLKILLPCLMAALALLCFIPRQASAQEGLGASRACAGHTLGTVNGCPACMEGENLHICENNFSDANFRGYLMDELFGSDSVPIEQVNNQTWIQCYEREIVSLKGIEFFLALEVLWCDRNQLTSLDVSQNQALKSLGCDSNQLTSLDVSQNPALNYLYCNSNQLTSLDVSQNPALEDLNCSYNQLTSLDVSKNLALEELHCYSNQLTSLDVSKNLALGELHCSSNQLTSLDVSQNPALYYLMCHSNQLTSLDVSQNVALEDLNCSYNQLTSLDVSQNPALDYLNCYSNQLTSLDVSGCMALTALECSYNQLTSLDVSKNLVLERLDCSSNQLTSLDLSHNCDLWNANYSDQTIQLTSPLPVLLDLSAIVGKENLVRIISVDTNHFDADSGRSMAEYDPATGIVDLRAREFYYDYDTQNEAAGSMRVYVTVLPQEVIPPDEDALKEAADIQDPSTDVEMDVDKQEGEVTDEEQEQVKKAVGVSTGFEIVSSFDITVYSFQKDGEGNEIPGSREAITQLKSAVTLTFITPNAEGKKYQVVRVHINAKGEVEVTLLPTTDNGDGTVSVESDQFSMYYLVEMEENPYKPGDINGDGKVNIFDVIRLLKKVTGESVETFASTDVNNDGKVNIFDVIRLLKYVTGEQVEVH